MNWEYSRDYIQNNSECILNTRTLFKLTQSRFILLSMSETTQTLRNQPPYSKWGRTGISPNFARSGRPDRSIPILYIKSLNVQQSSPKYCTGWEILLLPYKLYQAGTSLIKNIDCITYTRPTKSGTQVGSHTGSPLRKAHPADLTQFQPIVFIVYSSTWFYLLTKIISSFSSRNELFVDSQNADLLCISQSIYQYLMIKLFKQRIKYAFPSKT